jgi:uncharacterized RDD family membrane protein YckC
MQTIGVRTSQNVSINYSLASVGHRIAAYLIDAIIVVLICFCIAYLLRKANVYADWVYILFVGIPWLFFNLLSEILMDGQTFGKRIMNIQVIRVNGSPAVLGDFMFRWMFGIIEFTILGGLIPTLIIIIGGKGQRLGDIVAGTTVVELSKESDIRAENIFHVAENVHDVTYPQVTKLSEYDIEILRQTMEEINKTDNLNPALKVAEKIKSILGIESNGDVKEFIKTLIKDYYHLTNR